MTCVRPDRFGDPVPSSPGLAQDPTCYASYRWLAEDWLGPRYGARSARTYGLAACRRILVSVEPHGGVKPDPTASTDVDVEERGVGEAPYPCEETGVFDEEALDVGAVDVVDAKVERPSLRVAC